MSTRSHLRLVKDDDGFPYRGRSDDILVDIRPVDVDRGLLPASWRGSRSVWLVGDLWLAGRLLHRLALDSDGNAHAVMAGEHIPLSREDILHPLRTAIVAAARTAFGDDWAAGLAGLVMDDARRDGWQGSPHGLASVHPRVLRTLGEMASAVREPRGAAPF